MTPATPDTEAGQRLVEELLERLIAQGLVQRARANMEKGSTWVLEEKDGKVTGARYLAAP